MRAYLCYRNATGYCFACRQFKALLLLVRRHPEKLHGYKFNPSIAHRCLCRSEVILEDLTAACAQIHAQPGRRLDCRSRHRGDCCDRLHRSRQRVVFGPRVASHFRCKCGLM